MLPRYSRRSSPVFGTVVDGGLRVAAPLADRRRELLAVDRLVRIQDGQALDEILQLAHVAGPRVGRETIEGRLRERDRRPAVGFAAPHEIVDQRGQVVAALAQRRHDDRKHVEPEKQILAEFARAGARLEIAMSGRENADVGTALLAAADALENALLENAQQLHLHVDAHVADLVQEQRAAVGELEAPNARGQRAREGAFLVTEQLALEQLARNRAAVDRDERPARARGQLMNAPGDQLFAATGLAANQHRAVVACDLAHQLV